jgi:thioredoxin 1
LQFKKATKIGNREQKNIRLYSFIPTTNNPQNKEHKTMSNHIKYITLNAENFSREVLASDRPVIVDFFALWCGPCRVMNPIISELAEELDGIVKVGKLDVDVAPEIASEYAIQAVPTLIFFHQGRVVRQIPGLVAKQTILDEIRELVGEENAIAA